MTMKLNKASYEELIEHDVEWLKKQPDSFENAHIEAVLWDSIKHYYPDEQEKDKINP